MNLEHLTDEDRGLAIKIATLKVIQDQRRISNKTLDRVLGLRNGSTAKFFAGDPAHLYLVDRVERAIERISGRKARKRVATADVTARRELVNRAGEWMPADEWIKLVETSRGDSYSRMYYQQLMEELPFHGSVEDEEALYAE